MSDQDLIRRGDVLKLFPDGKPNWPAHAIRNVIAALPAVTDPQIAKLQAERDNLMEALRATDEKITVALKSDRRLIEALGEIAGAITENRALITPDMAQALKDRDERTRSQAISEFCEKAGIGALQQVQGLPHDVKMWRLSQTSVAKRAAAILADMEGK